MLKNFTELLDKSYFSVSKVPVYIHWSALIPFLLAFCSSDVRGILIVFTLYLYIFLHELAHVEMAKRFNNNTESIKLNLFGAVAYIKGATSDFAELCIVAAGPALNLFFCLVYFLLTSIASEPYKIAFAAQFLINFLIFVFNIIPVYPMDGGRILRSLLSTKIGYYDASIISLRIGQVVGAVFIIIFFAIGLYGLSILMAILVINTDSILKYRFDFFFTHYTRLVAKALDNPEILQYNQPQMRKLLLDLKDQKLRESLFVDLMIKCLDEEGEQVDTA